MVKSLFDINIKIEHVLMFQMHVSKDFMINLDHSQPLLNS